jgi:cytochrome c oxidase cbb3-type subunit 2
MRLHYQQACLGGNLYVTSISIAGVSPPLKGNSTVLKEDPSDHIKTILEELSNKVIDCVNYTSLMPLFASSLSDKGVAAVVNHERTLWGNVAPTVSADEAKALRN